ncbi:MAG: threonylcarbamoyl-AMP synthase [Verrucomicrobia bacterium]|nr:threonylcarbamoyl-AMP synthase [Verrucomicrobiota bacterium]
MILDPDQIPLAAQLLLQGELVAFPTETVYGLGAPIFHPETISKIYTAKGRPSDNPLIAHVASLAQVEQIARDIPPEFYLLAKAFFPGPLTIVLKKHPSVPSIVSGGLDTIAVRMPSHPVALALIVAVGQPLVAPSANLSGKPSSTTAEHVIADFEGKIGAVIEGGETKYGMESTVISLVAKVPRLLRLGALSPQEIEKVLGRELQEASREDKLSSPGTRYRHYAPSARVKLFTSPSELDLYLKTTTVQPRQILTKVKGASLYALLRQADVEKKDEILILCDAEMLQDRALMDRLQKASQ